MATKKAQSEKEKGNAAFKAADYPTAIGHYSAAILADRNDHTFPLNRAAAYLKLGKFEDAERDCTTVLALSALNAKALFRRGQARLELGKLDEALLDLDQAEKREPTNAAITEEIKKVKGLAAKRKPKAAAKPISVPSTAAETPKRRRVPIQIIETTPAIPSTSMAPSSSQTGGSVTKPVLPASQPQVEDSLKPISTRTLNQPFAPSKSTTVPSSKITPSLEPSATPSPRAPATPAATVPASPQPEQPRTFKDAKATRENTRPSRVGGGIFRASGQNTIFPTRETPSPGTGSPEGVGKSANSPTPRKQGDADVERTSSTAFPIAAPGSGRPLTLFDFMRVWESKPGLEDRWALMTSIPPTKIPSLFQTSLETSLLVSILQLFKEVLASTSPSSPQGELIEDFMKNFGGVKRFETVLLFMSKGEKQLAVNVWKQLDVGKDEAGGTWDKIWA